MKKQDNLLSSFYKNLIRTSKHKIDIYDLLVFSALLERWSSIVETLINHKAEREHIKIQKVEKAILYLEAANPEMVFLFSMNVQAIIVACNTALQTVKWQELGKRIGLDALDIPSTKFIIKKIVFRNF